MKFADITDRLPGFIKNKYIFTMVVFLLWLMFFDKVNMISMVSEKSKIHSLNADKAYYEKGLKQVNAQLQELSTNDESLEKFAREHYYFKAEGEDIYLIEE